MANMRIDEKDPFGRDVTVQEMLRRRQGDRFADTPAEHRGQKDEDPMPVQRSAELPEMVDETGKKVDPPDDDIMNFMAEMGTGAVRRPPSVREVVTEDQWNGVPASRNSGLSLQEVVAKHNPSPKLTVESVAASIYKVAPKAQAATIAKLAKQIVEDHAR